MSKCIMQQMEEDAEKDELAQLRSENADLLQRIKVLNIVGSEDKYSNLAKELLKIEGQNISLRSDNLRLQKAVDEAREAIDKAAHELGVPTRDYPAPVANAANILWTWLAAYPKES